MYNSNTNKNILSTIILYAIPWSGFFVFWFDSDSNKYILKLIPFLYLDKREWKEKKISGERRWYTFLSKLFTLPSNDIPLNVILYFAFIECKAANGFRSSLTAGAISNGINWRWTQMSESMLSTELVTHEYETNITVNPFVRLVHSIISIHSPPIVMHFIASRKFNICLISFPYGKLYLPRYSRVIDIINPLRGLFWFCFSLFKFLSYFFIMNIYIGYKYAAIFKIFLKSGFFVHYLIFFLLVGNFQSEMFTKMLANYCSFKRQIINYWLLLNAVPRISYQILYGTCTVTYQKVRLCFIKKLFVQ